MKHVNEIMAERIMQRLADLDLTARSVSIRVTGKPDLIRNITSRHTVPSGDKLIMLAVVLKCSAQWLAGKSDNMEPGEEMQPLIDRVEATLAKRAHEPEAPRSAPDSKYQHLVNEVREVGSEIANPQKLQQDIPVYGTALGGTASFNGEESMVAVEQTSLNTGEVIDFLRRPPGISPRRKVYGLYVSGHSMEPAIDSGSPVVVDPTRSPAIRDYVVVYLRNGEMLDDTVSRVLVKRLVRRSSSFVELEQFNPPSIFRVPANDVASMHRVVPLAELIGI